VKEKLGNLKEQFHNWSIFLKTFGDLLPGGIGVYEYSSDSVRPIYLSEGVKQLTYGLDSEYLDKAQENIRLLTSKKDYERLCKKVQEAIDNHTLLDCTICYQRTERKHGWIWVRAKVLRKHRDRYLFIALLLDVTKQKNMENELRVQSERYRLLEETSDEILFEIDIAKDVMTYSYRELNGGLVRQRIAHYSRSLRENPLVHQEHLKTFTEHLKYAMEYVTEGSLEYLSRISGRGYEWHRVAYHSIEDEDNRIIRIVGRIKNIHDEKLEQERQREVMSFGIDQYSGIQRTVQDMLENAELEVQHTLAILGVSHFKRIVEQNGVACGDAILRKTAEILQEIVSDMAIFGQMEDDRILLYFQNKQEDELDNIMRKIIDTVEHADYNVDGLQLSCRIGAAMMQGAVDYVTLYQEVEEALHIAKITKGENYIRV